MTFSIMLEFNVQSDFVPSSLVSCVHHELFSYTILASHIREAV